MMEFFVPILQMHAEAFFALLFLVALFGNFLAQGRTTCLRRCGHRQVSRLPLDLRVTSYVDHVLAHLKRQRERSRDQMRPAA